MEELTAREVWAALEVAGKLRELSKQTGLSFGITCVKNSGYAELVISDPTTMAPPLLVQKTDAGHYMGHVGRESIRGDINLMTETFKEQKEKRKGEKAWTKREETPGSLRLP